MIAFSLTRVLAPRAVVVPRLGPRSLIASGSTDAFLFSTKVKAKDVFEGDEHEGFHFVAADKILQEAAERRQMHERQLQMNQEFAKHWTYPVSYVSEEETKMRKEKEEKEDEVRHHAWE